MAALVAFDRGTRAFDGGLIRAHRLAQGVGVGFELIELRSRDDAFLHQLLVASCFGVRVFRLRDIAAEIGFGLAEARLVLGESRFGLPQRFLIGARIDLKQQVALVDVPPSVNLTARIWPATCDLTSTVAEASTVPTALMSTGTDSSVTWPTETGTGGCAPADWTGCDDLQPVRSKATMSAKDAGPMTKCGRKLRSSPNGWRKRFAKRTVFYYPRRGKGLRWGECAGCSSADLGWIGHSSLDPWPFPDELAFVVDVSDGSFGGDERESIPEG